jgi:hypothetical protein
MTIDQYSHIDEMKLQKILFYQDYSGPPKQAISSFVSHLYKLEIMSIVSFNLSANTSHEKLQVDYRHTFSNL